MDKKLIIRLAAYLAGLLILAFGLTMNVMTGLGVSPIISVSYAASEITGIAFADATFLLYVLFVIAELLIHAHLRRLTRTQLIKDVAQLPLSLLFTRFMALFLPLTVAGGAVSQAVSARSPAPAGASKAEPGTMATLASSRI